MESFLIGCVAGALLTFALYGIALALHRWIWR